MPDVLIVEDDVAFATLLMEYLRLHDIEVSHVETGGGGVARVAESPPDVVILDLMLPDMTGLSACIQMRGAFSGAIMMLTASQREIDHVSSLELGADDFMIKPIEPRVLLARLRTQLRRLGVDALRNAREETSWAVGPVEVDARTREVRVSGDLIPLTGMEFDVLRVLVARAGEVVTRDDLYDEVMGVKYDGLSRGVDVHISRVRQKLFEAGAERSILKAVRGSGYILACR